MLVYCSFYHLKDNNNEVVYYCSKPSCMIASRADVMCSCALCARQLFSFSQMCSLSSCSWTSLWHSMIPTIRSIPSAAQFQWAEDHDHLTELALGVEFALVSSSSDECTE